MVKEIHKYQAHFFQIAGFSYMAPFGKVILNAIDLELKDLNIKFFIYCIIAILLTLFGIILNIKGMEYLEGSE